MNILYNFNTLISTNNGKNHLSAYIPEEMKLVDVQTVSREGLANIREVAVKRRRSVQDKMQDYLKETGNPYCFRVGDVVVKNIYTEDGPKLNDLLRKLILSF